LCDVLPIFLFLDNLFKPDFCLQETNDKLNQIVNSTENYHCHYNSKIFKSKAKLVSHSRNHKFPKKYSCNQCSAQFFKHAALRQHSLICSKSNVNNLNCIDVPAPQKHAPIVTGVQRKKIEKEYKCLECGKIFANYHALYRHKKMHEGIIYRCLQCQSTFQTRSGLHNHSKSVHELRKFECHHCQTTFTTKSCLLNHITLHFNSIVYPCNQWSAQFIKHAALRQHSLICSKSNFNNLNCIDVPAPQKQAQIVTDVKKLENEYKCLECGKIFSKYQNFNNHKKRHKGIIYRCAQCPSTYKFKNGLNIHSKTHHDLRQFECHHCQTTFQKKHSLKTHMFLHFNSIVYTCNQCSAIFYNNSRLAFHLNNAHSSEK
jgi:KRAB domain-containing zinc finger protein